MSLSPTALDFAGNHFCKRSVRVPDIQPVATRFCPSRHSVSPNVAFAKTATASENRIAKEKCAEENHAHNISLGRDNRSSGTHGGGVVAESLPEIFKATGTET